MDTDAIRRELALLEALVADREKLWEQEAAVWQRLGMLIEEHQALSQSPERIVLSLHDAEAFCEGLRDAPAPNARLRNAMKQYSGGRQEQCGISG